MNEYIYTFYSFKSIFSNTLKLLIAYFLFLFSLVYDVDVILETPSTSSVSSGVKIIPREEMFSPPQIETKHSKDDEHVGIQTRREIEDNEVTLRERSSEQERQSLDVVAPIDETSSLVTEKYEKNQTMHSKTEGIIFLIACLVH